MSTTTNRLTRPRPVRRAKSEPVLTEAETLATIRGTYPKPPAEQAALDAVIAAKEREASDRRAADTVRRQRNRLFAIWALIVAACVLLAWPLGLGLRAVLS